MTREMTTKMTTTQTTRGSRPRSAPQHARPWDRVLARALAPRLDAELAAGCPAGFSRPLAIRAERIVSTAGRRELAHAWEHVLAEASRPPAALSTRWPLRHTRVAAAERDMREMLAILTGGLPITVRGAAMASALLRDGTGPLYSQRCPRDLGAAVRQATRELDALAAAPWA